MQRTQELPPAVYKACAYDFLNPAGV